MKKKMMMMTTMTKPDVMEALRQRFSGKILSPSALARYLRCPLQFFYRYAAQ
ncbi:MAG: PD-(D/E)XK nuclease family protein, partial [Prevotella sp.]|nr:PD-(D/E)XK nuclease family protein [Prevotella sp.]